MPNIYAQPRAAEKGVDYKTLTIFQIEECIGLSVVHRGHGQDVIDSRAIGIFLCDEKIFVGFGDEVESVVDEEGVGAVREGFKSYITYKPNAMPPPMRRWQQRQQMHI